MSAAAALVGAREVNVHLASWDDPHLGTKRWLPITILDGTAWDIPCGHGGHNTDASARKCSGLRKTWKFIREAAVADTHRLGVDPDNQVCVMHPSGSGEPDYAKRLNIAYRVFSRGGGERGLFRFSYVTPDIDPEVIYTLPPVPGTVRTLL